MKTNKGLKVLSVTEIRCWVYGSNERAYYATLEDGTKVGPDSKSLAAAGLSFRELRNSPALSHDGGCGACPSAAGCDILARWHELDKARKAAASR